MWSTLLLLAGLAVVGAGIHEAVLQRRLRRAGTRVDGLVVRHHRSTGTRGEGVTYTAVVEFTDAQGCSHQFQARTSGVKRLPVGGRAPVRYLPGAPSTARVDLTGKRVESVVLPLGAGGLFTAVAIWMLLGGR
ncbi:DUF3592 domain-containing protein [Streptomyces sp. NBC_01723]|uniref:DUF3592 domain-containing protein n=1 Tax=Streptomyces sp. NBC_01723 TaxID=2975921 RepID=UPI002E31FB30|nr:DUF3592 domain-containing protein [Streptomyces sp. NBC_01723]